MKMWIIIAVIVALVLFGTIVVANFALADSTSDDAEVTACETYGNSCTPKRNCGRATCGAVTGSSCGCG